MDGQTMFELVNFIKTGKATSGIIYKTFAAICTKAYLVSDRFGLNQKGNTITLEIPNEDKGLLIGKGGKNIKKINEALNALRPGAKCIIK
ncbi:MAG TPA: KH domain-containing protein [bacterium]|nr:KH domain-containing protein [bacterium]